MCPDRQIENGFTTCGLPGFSNHHKMFPLYMSIKNVLSRHPLHLTRDGHRTLPTVCSELIVATAILFTVEFGGLNELTDGNTDTQHKDDIFARPGHGKSVESVGYSVSKLQKRSRTHADSDSVGN
jgi:hypothetical protein